jgi:hypothetical protein
MQMSALFVATDLLSTKIFSFLKLDKKWLSYGPKQDAQIWAQALNFAVFGPQLAQISTFFNKTAFIS